MRHNGQEIATCRCGRKYYTYSMTVVDQSMCPICRAEEIEGAEATEEEVRRRAIERAKRQEKLEKGLPWGLPDDQFPRAPKNPRPDVFPDPWKPRIHGEPKDVSWMSMKTTMCVAV